MDFVADIPHLFPEVHSTTIFRKRLGFYGNTVMIDLDTYESHREVETRDCSRVPLIVQVRRCGGYGTLSFPRMGVMEFDLIYCTVPQVFSFRTTRMERILP